MAAYRIYESLPDARLQVGGGEAQPGHENAKSQLAITVMARVRTDNDREEEVQLWLTIPQIAVIVWAFFGETIRQNRTFANMLERLMRKRWSEMTSHFAKPIEGV